MGLDDIPLFAMLKSKLTYTNAREQVIGQNVANSDTPGYVPNDLKPFSFAAMAQAAATGMMATTEPGHMQGLKSPRGTNALKPIAAPDSEARVDGNQVVLEDQMIKLNDAKGDYETAIDLYTESLNMLTTAARAPGKAA